MNTRYLWISALLGGLISTALSNIPFINLVNCLLCAGFWIGPILAVLFYKRWTGEVNLKQSVIIGALAGLVAGILGFILSLVGLAGGEALMKSYARFIPPDAEISDLPTGPFLIFFNLIGVLVNIGFGALGGLAAGAILKPKTPAPQNPS